MTRNVPLEVLVNEATGQVMPPQFGPGKLSGIVEAMDEELYHAHPALSSTGARLLLKSPAKFDYDRKHPRAGKRAFDLGHAAHAKVLGVGAGVVAYPDEHLTPSGNVSTKAATLLWAEEQRAAGLTPVSPGEIDAVDAMAESVLAHPRARALFEAPGERELSVFADVDGVSVRARLDALVGDIGIDLKTTRKTADAEGFGREAADLGYHVQEAWYRAAMAAAGSPLSKFLFIVVEKEPPYLVGVNELDVIFQEMGKAAAAEARRRYRSGVETGVWPGYSNEIELASPPAWAAMLSDDLYGSEMQV